MVREWWISERGVPPPPPAVVGAVAAEGVIVKNEGVKLCPAVLDATAGKLQEGLAVGLRWGCPPPLYPPLPHHLRCPHLLHHSPLSLKNLPQVGPTVRAGTVAPELGAQTAA